MKNSRQNSFLLMLIWVYFYNFLPLPRIFPSYRIIEAAPFSSSSFHHEKKWEKMDQRMTKLSSLNFTNKGWVFHNVQEGVEVGGGSKENNLKMLIKRQYGITARKFNNRNGDEEREEQRKRKKKLFNLGSTTTMAE